MRNVKWVPVAVLLAAAGSAWSAPVVSLIAPASVTAGQSFSLIVQVKGVASTDNLNSLDVFLQQTDGASSSAFTITALDRSANVFSDLYTPNANILNQTIPSSGNTRDLGGATPDLSAVIAGDYTVTVLTLASSTSIGTGPYTISITSNPSTQWFDTNFDGHSFPSASATFTVAVPEPSCLGLLGAAGLLLGRRERRAGKVGG